MNEFTEEYYETSQFVSKEEAMRNLVSAILLRAVLDYRDMLVENIVWNGIDCDIQPTQAMMDMEHFFKNMGFDMYKKLIDGVVKFAKKAKTVKDEDFKNKNSNAFTCPVCGGKVRANYVKVRTVYITNRGWNTKQVKKCGCQDCLLKMVIE